MVKLMNLQIDNDKLTKALIFYYDRVTVPMPISFTLVSFGDCWDYESFLRSIEHLLLAPIIDKCYVEMKENDIHESVLSDVIGRTDVLCIATQLKDEQEIKDLQIFVDLAEKNHVFYTTIMLCNEKSRNSQQEKVVERVKEQVNAVIDLTSYNSLQVGRIDDAASCVVRSIFHACIFKNRILRIEPEDLRSGIKEHDVALISIVRATVHIHNDQYETHAEKILQAIVEQISLQQRDLMQAHNVYLVTFCNPGTLGVSLMSQFYATMEKIENNVIVGVIDDAMKDRDVLVVTIASGFER